ncbi:hypothetical protein [Methylomicrobium sp. Wu6]|uniref:type IV pilus modification PilV family protein n=1 Tax=Methylomicrobium sp. Wu6 TaxID=3107928 RepID=UPI002DD64C21|nr:hypothetical protein [Methylomicrobium sp. Wu6]MEC4750023.1 hypothetical protein [Methylomicrobium sp. Wu6]
MAEKSLIELPVALLAVGVGVISLLGVMLMLANLFREMIRQMSPAQEMPARPGKQVCNYPDCNCPFDAPADPNWCAWGYPHEGVE